MATEVCADLTAIQDEDVLRRMWADTEDFSRKKEIRARMYKLREQRLKDFYTSGDDAEINRKHQPTRHADTLQDQGFMTMKSKEIRDSESPTRDISIRKGNGYWDTRQETVYGRGKEDDKNVEIKYVDLEGRGVVKEDGIETKMAYATQTAKEKGWKEDENGSLKSEALTKVSQSASVSKGDNSEERSMSKKEEFSKRTEQKSSNSMSTSYSTSSSSSSRRVISSSYQIGDQDLSQNAIQYDVTSGKDFTTDNQNISKEDKTFSSQNEFKNSKEEKTVKNESKSVQEENAFSSQIESKREEKTITSQNSSNQLNTEEIKNLKNSEFIDSHRDTFVDVSQVDRRDVKENKVEDVQKFTTQNTSEVTSKNEKVTEQKILNEIQKLDSYLSTHTPAPSTPISPQEPDGGWTLVSDKNDKNNEFLYQERTQPIKPQATSMDLPTSATDGQYTTTYQQSYNKISVDHSPSHDFFAKTLRSSPERSTPSPTKSVHSTSSRGSPERKKTSSKTSLERNSPVIKRSETKSPEKRRERIETKVETKSKRKFSTTKEKAANRNRVATPGASPTQSPVHKKLNKDSSDSDSDASQLTYNKHERKSQIKKEQSPGYSSEGSITKEIKKKESSPERSAFAPIKNFRTSPEKEKKELTIENVREHDDFILNETKSEVSQNEVKTEIIDMSQNEMSKCYSTDTYVLEERAQEIDQRSKQTSKEVLNRSPASSPERSPERNSQRSESPTKKITTSTKVSTEIRSSSPTKKVTNSFDRSPSPTKKTTEIRRNSTEKTTKTQRSASPTKKMPEVRSIPTDSPSKRKIEPRSSTDKIERPNRSASPTKKRTETLNRSFSERRTTKTTETVQRRGSADKNVTTKISSQKLSELSKPKQIPTRETLRTPVKSVQKTVKTEYKSPVRVAPKKTPEPKKTELRKAPETKKTPEPKKTPVSTRTVQNVVQKTIQTKVVKEAPKTVKSTTVTRFAKKDPAKRPETITRRPSEEKKPPSRNNSQKSITKSVPKTKVEKITVTSAQETKRRETQNFLKKETQGVSDLEDETPPDEFFADYDDEDTVDYKQRSDKQTKYKRETDQDYLNVIVQLPKSSRESSPGYPENFIATTSEEGESNPRYADFVSEPEDVEVFAPLSGPSGPIESTEEEIPKSVAEKVSVFLNEAKKSLETKTTTNQVVIEKSVSEAKTLFENASKNDVPVKPEIEEFNQVINKVSKEVPKIPRKDTPVPKPPGKTFVKEEDKPSNLDVNSKKSFFENKAQETYMKSTVASDVRVRTPEKPKETERKPSIEGSYMRSTLASDVRVRSDKSEIERKPSKTEVTDGSYMRSTLSSDVRSRSPVKETERKPSKPDITDGPRSTERRQSTDITETYMKSTIASRSHSPEQRKSSLAKEQVSPAFKSTERRQSTDITETYMKSTIASRSHSPEQRKSSLVKEQDSPTFKSTKVDTSEKSSTRRSSKTDEKRSPSPKKQRSPSPSKKERSPSPKKRSPSPEKSSLTKPVRINESMTKTKTEEKFGVQLRKTPSATKFELSQPRKSLTGELPEIENIFDLEILEQLLIKAEGYEERRRIRAQIRLVKKELEEKHNNAIRTPAKNSHYFVSRNVQEQTTKSSNTKTFEPKKPVTKTYEEKTTRKSSSPERKGFDVLKTTTVTTQSTYKRSSPERQVKSSQSQPQKEKPFTKQSSTDKVDSYLTRKSSKDTTEIKETLSSRKSSSDKFDTSFLNRKSSSDKFDSSVLNRKSSQDSTDKTYSSRRSSDKLEFTRKPTEETFSTRSTTTKTSSTEKNDNRKSSTESSSFLSTRRSSTEGVKDAKIKPIESPFFAKDAALAEKSGVQKRTFERKVTTTTTTTTKKNVSETDSITSSYGVGPTDENGRPLFGLRALRKSNNTEQTPANETVCTKQTTYTTQTYTTETNSSNSPVSLASLKNISDTGRRYSGPEIVEVTDEQYNSKKRTSKDYTVEEASDLNQENVMAFTSHMRDYQAKTEDKKPFVRGDSVKALQHKFQQATEAANQPSGGSSYPKAGLILRSNSLLQYDDPNQMSSSMKRTKVERVEKRTVHDSYDGVGEKQVVVKAQMSEKVEDSNGLKSARDLRGVQAVQTTLTRDGPVEKSATAMRMTTTSGGTTSTTSFLDNNSKVTGVQDILTRMRNADLVTETGDTAEDAQARALLNKFLGASVILQGMEQGMKHETGQQRSATLVGQADKQLVKATNRIREENIDEIYDESQLKNLLDSSTDLEDRRKLRARLREMAEEKEYTASLGATEEEFAPAKVHTRVTSSTAKLTKANSVQSPFAKFKQLERQNSAPSCGRTLKVSETRFPTSASSIKERLLGWVQAQTREYKNVQVENFSTSWSDGLAFCALIHHFCPDAFDFSTLTPNRRRYNFELAFKVAEEKADIYPLLDAEDMVTMSKPDWKCVFTYVQSIYQKFHDSPLSVPTNPYL